MALDPIRDRDAFTTTREALHAVAEHVLAAFRYRVERRIGLVAADVGFGTPELLGGEWARVAGHELVVARGGDEHRSPLTTLAAAGAACGIEPGAPGVYPPVTPLTLNAPLPVDDEAAQRLAAWLAFGWSLLDELAGAGTSPTLWPEHFDAAVELGDEQQGTRGTYGASPGDDMHAEPYLYVTHWAEKPTHPFWNDAAFGGASVSYSALVDRDDPADAARSFFTEGLALVSSA